MRPIAVGELFYRVATKAILATSFRPEMLLPGQLGVGSPGGTEPALFLLDEAIRGPNQAGYARVVSVDLHNAFNDVGRAAVAAAVATYAPELYKPASWAYTHNLPTPPTWNTPPVLHPIYHPAHTNQPYSSSVTEGLVHLPDSHSLAEEQEGLVDGEGLVYADDSRSQRLEGPIYPTPPSRRRAMERDGSPEVESPLKRARVGRPRNWAIVGGN